MADSVIARNVPFRWHYEHGLVILAVERLGRRTHNPKYLHWVKDGIDRVIDAAGNIDTYSLEEYNLDQINPGKVLFPLYSATGDDRYRRAIQRLRDQLKTHPRTRDGGFWHKKIYPHQMWLDGIYMAAPFYAAFGAIFDDPAAWGDVARQILLIEKHTRDPKTGLLYHGWDESRQQRWANPETGCSPNFWGRAIGWFLMALVDVLDYIPPDDARRSAITGVFERAVAAVVSVQDRATGLWYQVLDQGSRPGNYLEASASCMFTYAIAKGVRNGYLAPAQLEAARRAYRGIHGLLIEIDAQGWVNLNGTCAVAGLGGDPYRDGSYDYYVHAPIAVNDYKGVGPFILASLEMESLG